MRKFKHNSYFYKAIVLIVVLVLFISTTIPCFALENGEPLPSRNQYLNNIYNTKVMKFNRFVFSYDTTSSTPENEIWTSGTWFEYTNFQNGNTANIQSIIPTNYVGVNFIEIDLVDDYSTQIYNPDPEIVFNRYVTVYFRMAFENDFKKLPPAGFEPKINITIADPIWNVVDTKTITGATTKIEAYPPDNNEYVPNNFFIFDITCSFYVDGETNKLWTPNQQWITKILINFENEYKIDMNQYEMLEGAITTLQVASSEKPLMKTPNGYIENGNEIGDIFIQEEQQIQIDIYNAEQGINKKPINDVVNSEAYRQIANMYQSFWDWSYLEALVLLVLTFGLLSFVLFGKKG